MVSETERVGVCGGGKACEVNLEHVWGKGECLCEVVEVLSEEGVCCMNFYLC